MALVHRVKGVAASVASVLAGGAMGNVSYHVLGGGRVAAAESEPSKAASDGGRRQLACAPQFDGLECFETIVTTGKHPVSPKQPSATEKLVPRNRGLAIAPQFDGLNCFETITYRK